MGSPEEELKFAKTLIATYMLALKSVIDGWSKADPTINPEELETAVVKVSALEVDELSEGMVNAFITDSLDRASAL